MKTPDVPLGATAKAVLERARDEAARFQHEYVGTEHLAVALLRLTPLIANRLMQDLGVTAKAMRASIETALAAVPVSAQADGSRPFTARTHRVFAAARRHAVALGERVVGAEHLLVGLLHEPCAGGTLLVRHGLTADAVLAALRH